jgi:hypothetical protein
MTYDVTTWDHDRVHIGIRDIFMGIALQIGDDCPSKVDQSGFVRGREMLTPRSQHSPGRRS